jgi:phage gpG-like protein
MELKDLRDLLLKKGKEIEDLTRRKMPTIAGAMAKAHFQDNFRKSGFVDNGLQPWKPAKRIGQDKSAENNYKTLTSGRNHLMSSIQYIPGNARVTIRNNVEYAAIHNEGGTFQIHPAVTTKMRKFAWAKYFEAMGGTKETKNMTIPEDAAKWKRMALTKKAKLDIKIVMPKRQFMGDSKELNEKIAAKWEQKISKILNI